MMYAVYRHYGNEVFSGENLLFVTASKRVAEDAVALAQLEQEEARSIQRPQWEDIELYVVHINKITEYEAKVKAILTVDPEGIDDDFSYYYEEVEVR